MAKTPEQQAREEIDAALVAAGWLLQDAAEANLFAGRGIAVREFPLKSGHGHADYALFVDGRRAASSRRRRPGVPLTGVEVQAEKYSKGLATLPRLPAAPVPEAGAVRPLHGIGLTATFIQLLVC